MPRAKLLDDFRHSCQWWYTHGRKLSNYEARQHVYHELDKRHDVDRVTKHIRQIRHVLDCVEEEAKNGA